MTFLKTPLGEEPVIVEGRFEASPQRVFRAWTDPSEIPKWFGPGDNKVKSARIDLRVGGNWRFDYGRREGQLDWFEGEYLEVVPDRRLVFTWKHTREYDDGRIEETAASKVSIDIDEIDQSSSVRLVHEAIVQAEGRTGVGQGWEGTFINLVEYLQVR